MVINYQKPKVLICNSKECNQEAIDIGGKSIEIVQKIKYLGEVLTSDLKLKNHIEEERITTQAILNTCLYGASNEVLSKIGMITILKKLFPHYSTVVKHGSLQKMTNKIYSIYNYPSSEKLIKLLNQYQKYHSMEKLEN